MNNKKLGAVVDLVFTDGEKYAEVSHIIYLTEKKRRKMISWNCVKELKDPTDNKKTDIDIYLNIPDENLQLMPEYDHELLMSSLLDKQLIDVDGLRVVRVNDIILGKVESKFCIVAVDVGTKGLLRRAGLSIFSKVFPKIREHVIPWEYVEPIQGEVSNLRIKIKKSKVSDLRPEDIADIMEDMSHTERVLIFNTLDSQKAAETLVEAEPDVQKSVVTGLKSKRIVEIIESMSSDEAAELLEMLPGHKSEELLSMMRPEKAEVVKKLLQYSGDVAGGLMSTSFTTISVTFTAEQVINRLRELSLSPQKAYYLYVTDDEGKLVGVLSLRDLVISPAERKVVEFMITDVLRVTVETPKEEVYKAINKYNLMALPVIDLKGKLVGVIHADDVIDLMIPRALKKERVKIKGQFRKRKRKSEQKDTKDVKTVKNGILQQHVSHLQTPQHQTHMHQPDNSQHGLNSHHQK